VELHFDIRPEQTLWGTQGVWKSEIDGERHEAQPGGWGGVIPSLFVPPLSQVIRAIADLWSTGELVRNSLISLQRAFIGFAAAVVLGLPLGLLVGGWFPRVQTALEPLMELFAQANPLVLFHIIILFLGIGEAPKTFIIGWLCLWPVTFSAINGIQNVDPLVLKAARSFGVGRGRLFVSVILPFAAPAIFAGLRLAAGYAFIMLVAAEMMGASSGLGWLVLSAQELLRDAHLRRCHGDYLFRLGGRRRTEVDREANRAGT
jgi:NitT/TauT family transport system permease protein